MTAPCDDVLAGVYEPEVLAAIDDPGRSRRREPDRGLRGRLAGAIVVAGLTGARVALDEPGAGAGVAEVRPEPTRPVPEAVTVHLAWDDPAASVALVRPWLLRTRPGPAVVRLMAPA